MDCLRQQLLLRDQFDRLEDRKLCGRHDGKKQADSVQTISFDGLPCCEFLEGSPSST